MSVDIEPINLEVDRERHRGLDHRQCQHRFADHGMGSGIANPLQDLLHDRWAGDDFFARRASGADPVLVTGDFNAGETNPAFQQLLGAPEVALFDTFRSLHPAAREVGTFNGFEGTTSGEKIDAVLASEDWEILAAEIDRATRQGRYPSDHFPVTATLTLR